MPDYIEPKVLKGFRDFLPQDEIPRRALIGAIERVYRSYGYAPIDTPALEYAEILFGKGGGETDKQVYRFTDGGGRDVALRFDLTVPLARFVAARRGALAFPFKRYHIGKVWRGENTQRGRYREFIQCDCDAIGDDGAASDFETLCLTRDALEAAGAGAVAVKVNHRGLFNRFLARLGAEARAADILRAVDKRDKIGRDEVRRALASLAGNAAADEILAYVEEAGDWDATLARMARAAGGDCPETERLRRVRRYLEDAGLAGHVGLDPSITRGLDYYTGIVFETFLTDMPGLGSVCSGGRYDDLAGLYGAEKLPGVGASIGLDRLIAGLSALGRLAPRASYVEATVAAPDEEAAGYYQRLASRLRSAGVACEIRAANPRKLGALYAASEALGARFVLVPGPGGSAPDEARNLTLRELASRKDTPNLSIGEAVARVTAARGGRETGGGYV